jgi:hypothetical protein
MREASSSWRRPVTLRQRLLQPRSQPPHLLKLPERRLRRPQLLLPRQNLWHRKLELNLIAR